MAELIANLRGPAGEDGGGGAAKTLTYASNGTFNPADFPYATGFLIELQGGGGGGGGAGSSTGTGAGQAAVGSGGGGGGYLQVWRHPSQITSTQTVTVGAGGSGGTSSASPKVGGTSQFGFTFAAGGGPGANMTAQSGQFMVAGGFGDSGDFGAVSGSSGGPGVVLTGGVPLPLAHGGGAVLGGGPACPVSSSNGNPSGLGGGGSGGFAAAGQTFKFGGSGGSGRVKIHVYGWAPIIATPGTPGTFSTGTSPSSNAFSTVYNSASVSTADVVSSTSAAWAREQYVTSSNGANWTWNGSSWSNWVAPATTAVAGSPGSYLPNGTTGEGPQFANNTITADPTSAWASDQYVTDNDGQNWTWNGSQWTIWFPVAHPGEQTSFDDFQFDTGQVTADPTFPWDPSQPCFSVQGTAFLWDGNAWQRRL